MSISNVEELREYLAAQLEKVSTGELTPASANASANLAGKILSSVKMELEYNKMVGANANIGFLGKIKNKALEKLSHDPTTGELK